MGARNLTAFAQNQSGALIFIVTESFPNTRQIPGS